MNVEVALATMAVVAGFATRPALGRDDPRAERLAAAAAKILARKELDGATIGIDVRSLTRGERVWSKNADRAFAPASNLKLVTLDLSLSILGPDYEFSTPLVATGPVVEGGRLEGDLWIRGGGDPSLAPGFFESEDATAPLEPFVQALALQGVKQIRGDLVVDARAFDDAFVPEGWPADQLDEDYAAPVAALSLNGNCLHVRVAAHGGAAPSALLEPEVFGWRLENSLALGAAADEFKVGVFPPDVHGIVRVRGTVGGDVGAAIAKVPVPDPPLFFGLALRAALERAGIAIGGQVRRAHADERLGDHARVLYAKKSALLPALEVCGKESDNNIAEHLLKSCAFARCGRGTWENGAKLVENLCRELGVESSNVRIVDGSGLSRLDQVTPALLASLLAHAYAAPWRDAFIRCLPISGVDGTLQKRMTEPAMEYRVRAKTGFIAQVSALSGFALSGDEPAQEVFAFSILVNGFKGSNAEMKRVEDDLCRAIVALPR